MRGISLPLGAPLGFVRPVVAFQCRMPSSVPRFVTASQQGGIDTDSRSYTAQLEDCVERGDAVAAMLVMQAVQGAEQEAHHFALAIEACAKSATPQVKRSRSLLRRMVGGGFAPDRAALEAVISTCCRGGQLAAALEELALAESRGLELPTMYMLALETASTWGPASEAQQLLESVLTRCKAMAIESGESVATLRRRAYALALSSAAKVAAAAETDEERSAVSRQVDLLIERMQAEEVAHDSFSQAAAAQAFLATGRAAEAADLLAKHEAPGSSAVYHKVLAALQAARLPEHVPKVLKAMLELDKLQLHPLQYRIAAASYAHAADVDGALALVKEMRERGVEIDKFTCSSIMGATVRGGNPGAAITFLKDIILEAAARKSAGKQSEDPSEDGVVTVSGAFNSCIKALANNDYLNEAQQLAKTAKKSKIRLSEEARRHLVSALGRAGEWEKAADEVDAALGAGAAPCLGDFNVAFRGCRADYQRALRFFERMKALGVKPTVVSYGCALDVCAKASKPEAAAAAVALLNELMDSEDLKANRIIFTTVIDALGKGGAYKKVLPMLELMRLQGEEPGVETYTAAISAMARGAQLMVALALLREMRSKGLAPNHMTYSAAMDACARTGQAEAALGLMEQMRAENISPNGVHYALCITAFDQRSELRAATKELLQDMLGADLGSDVNSLNAALYAVCVSDHRHMVFPLLDRAIEAKIEANEETRRTVMGSCRTSEERARASFLLEKLGAPVTQEVQPEKVKGRPGAAIKQRIFSGDSDRDG